MYEVGSPDMDKCAAVLVVLGNRVGVPNNTDGEIIKYLLDKGKVCHASLRTFFGSYPARGPNADILLMWANTAQVACCADSM
jgi:hypothetical protein